MSYIQSRPWTPPTDHSQGGLGQTDVLWWDEEGGEGQGLLLVLVGDPNDAHARRVVLHGVGHGVPLLLPLLLGEWMRCRVMGSITGADQHPTPMLA